MPIPFYILPTDGKIERLKLGNGLWEKANFNSRMQVTELNLGHGLDGDLWKLGYQYGEIDDSGNVDTSKNTGNIARQTLTFNGLGQPFIQNYKYDSLYRLTEATETNNSSQTWKETYGYDRYVNRAAHAKFQATTLLALDNHTDPTIDSNTNRFNPNQGYTYDKNGNLPVDADSRAFTFNGDNKQTQVKDANGNVVGQYIYDGEGKRVKKQTYDSGGVLQEITVFVYSSGKLIAEYSTKPPPQNPATSYTATDKIGSPRVITNALGDVVSRRDFTPFGEEIVPDGTTRLTGLKYTYGDDIRQKFTGYQKDDETGLDFADARMYQDLHGRFTAVDPLLASGKSANPQTFNRFVYCFNNPLSMTDPGGLQAGDWYKQPFVSPDGNDISNIRHPGWKPVDFYRVHDAGDGYRYYVTPGGWTQLGKTEDLIEDDISDLQSVKIGLMRMANGPFNMPLDPNNPFTTPSIRQLTGFQPFSDEEVNTKTWRDWGIATCTEFGVGLLTSEIGGEAADEAEVASFAGRNPFSSVETYETGSFSIRDWTGYPEGYPKPSNPVRIVSGEEYETNFALKKVANRDLHIENPSWKGFHIHEIQPIKFGGDPVDPANKILLLPEEHYRFNAFWNRLQRSIEKK